MIGGILFLIVSVVAIDDDSIEISTNLGPIEGRVIRSTGRRVFAFQGIPYAEPPEGPLRWKAPIPINIWPEPAPLMAKDYSRACAQLGKFRDFSSEDCLYLNVFTPSLNIQAGLPVLIWIHGGGFSQGSSADYVPLDIAENLVKRGIVLVTFNYRLGPFGFFSTRTADAPGNIAFLDQLEVLRWVSSHIAAFGGDPNQVTLGGQGSGAVSASILSLSNLSNGYFTRLILQSESASTPGAVSTEGNANASRWLALESGCSTASEWSSSSSYFLADRVVTCLLDKSTEELLKASERLPPQEAAWAAIEDGNVLADSVDNLLKYRRPFDALLGVNADEWGLNAMSLLSGGKAIDEFTSEDVRQQLSKIIDDQGLIELAEAIYVDAADGGWFERLLRMNTELHFTVPILREASSLLRQNSRVYLYKMDHVSQNAFRGAQWKGAVHGSELPYLFGDFEHWDVYPGSSFSPTQQDIQVQDLLGEMWTGFVKNGNPSSVSNQLFWPSIYINTTTSELESNYLSISATPRLNANYCPRCKSILRALNGPDGRRSSNKIESVVSKRDPPATLAVREASQAGGFGSNYVIGLWVGLGVALLLIVVLCIALCFLRKQRQKFTPPYLPGIH